ncbi:transcription-repair coupling factor [Anaerosalibacter sp. Marseille-P3206]|uniref:transcription-repair coupling factor n=1 Tax=Anaerosalibacter sp. Marseille-P3206 TaxID=1871005 RepID=UPI00190EAD03|nr:transcription-repair coupling factor [Anaerosalibacter sp. Marseille-P3206]
MTQNMFIDPLKNMTSYKKLVEEIKSNISPISIHGIGIENIGHIVYGVRQEIDRQVLVIASDEVKAKKIFEDLKKFENDNVEFFPSREVVFYDIEAFSYETVHKRLNVLTRLSRGEKIVVVTHIEALLSKILSNSLFHKYTEEINYGDTVDLYELLNSFVTKGYERVTTIEGVGQFSVRGGIIDFFPPYSKNPFRIELFDDEVDSIRTFDLIGQRSIENVAKVYITPTKEILMLDIYKDEVATNMENDLEDVISKFKNNQIVGDKLEEKFKKYIETVREGLSVSNVDMIVPYIPNNQLGCLVDYLSEESIVLIDEPSRVEMSTNEKKNEFNFKFADVYESGELLPKHQDIFFDFEMIKKAIKKQICITTSALLKSDDVFRPQSIIGITSKSMQSFHNKIDFLVEELNHYKYRGYKTIIFSGTLDRGKRLETVLREKGIECVYVEDSNREIKTSQIFITEGSIHRGFEYPNIKFALISDKEVYGTIKRKTRKPTKKDREKIVSFSDLKIGDYVVHENHGIGQYLGIEQLDIQGIKKDYMTIKYQGKDKLYVPIDQMNLIQRYIGSDSNKPKVNKLSSSEWTKTKAKAKKAIEDMAKELLELYAKREVSTGYAFSKDTPWQAQFEDVFPYEETEAQLRCIEEIKGDMEKQKPMDRLLCGDVGYGKTEVAIRAAFKAIMDNKQVAFLVPTTILAQQHYNTIIERFGDFPVKVGMLSRFRTQAQQKKDLADLRKGNLDIIVGTHRLLSKDVIFNDLGLLIVDEEQRFGVKHKESLKQLKENVDVLTLTATPIPRTLHMSLIGIRDMSVIDMPPEERYPIQTYVVEYNEQLIREAIIKEIVRNGQVYFVYNRVETIDKMASIIKKLVPEARVAVAHGQMGERQLESIMLDFLEGDYDVLVCTTIIETGLDIPNVNTIIVNNADKMGLSQLYQLRGRVGRSNRLAYAYLMYERNKVLSEVAEKRLKAIKEFTEFGSGFKIAMRDLEIRGAGNLLGLEQHGHIEAIGYDLYVKFLNETIRRFKGEDHQELVDTTIELNVDGFIPDRYIKEGEIKIEIYKKIASIETVEDYDDLVEELIDRFGDIPVQVDNLMKISYIKYVSSRLGIISITQIKDGIKLELSSSNNITASLIHELSKEYGRRIYFDLSNKPSFRFRPGKDLLTGLKELVEKIRGSLS